MGLNRGGSFWIAGPIPIPWLGCLQRVRLSGACCMPMGACLCCWWYCMVVTITCLPRRPSISPGFHHFLEKFSDARLSRPASGSLQVFACFVPWDLQGRRSAVQWRILCHHSHYLGWYLPCPRFLIRFGLAQWQAVWTIVAAAPPGPCFNRARCADLGPKYRLGLSLWERIPGNCIAAVPTWPKYGQVSACRRVLGSQNWFGRRMVAHELSICRAQIWSGSQIRSKSPKPVLDVLEVSWKFQAMLASACVKIHPLLSKPDNSRPTAVIIVIDMLQVKHGPWVRLVPILRELLLSFLHRH